MRSARIILTSIAFSNLGSAGGPGIEPPALPREFRAAWVATVANIDWPSKPGLAPERQREEFIQILDRCVDLRLNAVILQIRPMCDALYASNLEPWSEFLTGEMGKPPTPFYDPLEFAVREAHARGLELHAWFNPYRAHHPSAKSPIAPNHIVRRKPDLAPRYGKHHWMTPTEEAVQKWSLDVVRDVVARYDLDGIHMDDYFYPYPERDENNRPIPFPDDAGWKAYLAAGGTLNRDDWRRDAVNAFVRTLYHDVKRLKPWVKVGISPFGIWRPGHPPGIEGFDQYASLYADAKLWLNEGWVDYFTPQLYWPTSQEKQSYPKLLQWWLGENTKQRHLWPGNSVGRAVGRGLGPAELEKQIELTRSSGAYGNVFFSMKSLQRNRDVEKALRTMYKGPALVPASEWLKSDPKATKETTFSVSRDQTMISIRLPHPHSVGWLLVQTCEKSSDPAKWNSTLHFVQGKDALKIELPNSPRVAHVVATGFDRAFCELGKAAASFEN